jgi:hypothetical protein
MGIRIGGPGPEPYSFSDKHSGLFRDADDLRKIVDQLRGTPDFWQGIDIAPGTDRIPHRRLSGSYELRCPTGHSYSVSWLLFSEREKKLDISGVIQKRKTPFVLFPFDVREKKGPLARFDWQYRPTRHFAEDHKANSGSLVIEEKPNEAISVYDATGFEYSITPLTRFVAFFAERVSDDNDNYPDDRFGPRMAPEMLGFYLGSVNTALQLRNLQQVWNPPRH